MALDVVVVGGGLAGLSAARDLAAEGADVVVLEARGRPGGRVEQTFLADGRPVQLGGEVMGEFHTSYRALVKELGLTIEPAFPHVPGKETSVLADGSVHMADDFGWMDDDDMASYAQAEEEFRSLARTVDPDDPWSHPEAARLDGISVGAWLRAAGATPNVIRARELAALALAGGSIERTSLLADLRKEAVAGAGGFYDYDAWEADRVAEGSATVALKMAEELGHRIRYSTAVKRIDVRQDRTAVTTTTGERFGAEAVVCAVPVGPLRDIQITGVNEDRLQSLHRQRHAPAAKVVFAYPTSFWEAQGQNGSAYSEAGLMGGTWPQRDGIMSALVPPERLTPFLASAPQTVEHDLLAEMVGMYGTAARHPDAVFIRHWGIDPFTRGYITEWRPGDVMRVGRLHGTHAPPFYVCGSDQWVCGYMEGAVRTGRGAAAAALG
jgi:monoamine oxidase